MPRLIYKHTLLQSKRLTASEFKSVNNCTHFCSIFSSTTTAQPENSTNSNSNSKYYKCPEEEKMILIHSIKDIHVTKDIACFPDPTWTEVNLNLHNKIVSTPSIVEVVR